MSDTAVVAVGFVVGAAVFIAVDAVIRARRPSTLHGVSSNSGARGSATAPRATPMRPLNREPWGAL